MLFQRQAHVCYTQKKYIFNKTKFKKSREIQVIAMRPYEVKRLRDALDRLKIEDVTKLQEEIYFQERNLMMLKVFSTTSQSLALTAAAPSSSFGISKISTIISSTVSIFVDGARIKTARYHKKKLDNLLKEYQGVFQIYVDYLKNITNRKDFPEELRAQIDEQLNKVDIHMEKIMQISQQGKTEKFNMKLRKDVDLFLLKLAIYPILAVAINGRGLKFFNSGFFGSVFLCAANFLYLMPFHSFSGSLEVEINSFYMKLQHIKEIWYLWRSIVTLIGGDNDAA